METFTSLSAEIDAHMQSLVDRGTEEDAKKQQISHWWTVGTARGSDMVPDVGKA